LNENAKKLLELVATNPNLPIVPMVDAEIFGDDFGTYMGGWGASCVDEYIIDGKGMVRFKSDDDVIDVLEHALSKEEFDALPESEADCRPRYDALPWVKAIVVDIVMPDV